MIIKNKVNNLQVKIKKLHPKAIIPRYAKTGDAAMDLYATERGQADECGNMVYKTGLAVEIPYGFVGLIFPRSSISKTKQMLRNHVGVIDSGYRGRGILKFGWFDESTAPNTAVYDGGDRIGQLMIIPYPQVDFIEVDELSNSDRGSGGFGSTGQ
jgi:dUTP pyrophosphatase